VGTGGFLRTQESSNQRTRGRLNQQVLRSLCAPVDYVNLLRLLLTSSCLADQRHLNSTLLIWNES